MKAEYSFDPDTAHGLMRVRMAGFFEPGDVARFAADLMEQLAQLGRPPGEHLTLVDIRAMDIQSQQAVERFEQVLANSPMRSRRLAFVVGRSLSRMQIKRAASSRDAGYFQAPERAEAWLLGNDDAAAA
ncbi:hypothetical protein [uncultured Sphingomonas sp.]|uniref:hypothetical protein n=1 Tax=uncultured Sphingomonas sp. TaxID=158754 RepID=UPI00258EB752|nr:hypothetical protein [uncultured Sphingomonas sp.]